MHEQRGAWRETVMAVNVNMNSRNSCCVSDEYYKLHGTNPLCHLTDDRSNNQLIAFRLLRDEPSIFCFSACG